MTERLAPSTSQPRLRRFDPRWWQICCLSGLLCYGLFWLSFDTPLAQVAVTIGTAMLVQLGLTRTLRIPGFEWKSALISGLGLCFLFRSNFLWMAALTAALAIGSKFLI